MAATETTTNDSLDYEYVEDDAPILLNAREVARLLGIGERSVWRYVSRGHLPKPLSLGNMKRWRRQEIEQHLEAASRAANRKRMKDHGYGVQA